MSFNKEQNSLFPDPERRHFSPGEAPRAARSTLGPGLLPVEQEPDAWGHHLTRTGLAHKAPHGSVQAPVVPSQGGDARWQSSYQAQTAQNYTDDGAGRPTRRGGKKMLATPGRIPGQPPFSPFTGAGARSSLSRQDESAIHDGTTKNSAHIPGFSGHIPAANKELANKVVARNTHDKSMFMENYAANLKTIGRSVF